MHIKSGQRITFKPEFFAPGDEGVVFIAIEDSFDGFVRVEAQVALPFKPIQDVETRMIARAS